MNDTITPPKTKHTVTVKRNTGNLTASIFCDGDTEVYQQTYEDAGSISTILRLGDIQIYPDGDCLAHLLRAVTVAIAQRKELTNKPAGTKALAEANLVVPV